jgi:UDP-N-acetylglucosamine 2-epimerase (non-hydrolysing)
VSRKIVAVVGTRPNLVKIAPILRAIGQHEPGAGETRLMPVLVHTGQHYDDGLSGRFFADLRLPAPDHQLKAGSGSHAAQTADIMRRLEPVLVSERPDLVLVVGDVNSTLAAALTAAQLHLPIAHVEAGLRSFDRSMPEELNRIVTDVLSDILFTTEADADANLRREGRPAEAIHFVGNVMVDSLLWALPLSEPSTILDQLGLARGQDFALLTVHRPSNVDVRAALTEILSIAAELAAELPVIFPAHPRTRARIAEWDLSRYVRDRGRPAAGCPAHRTARLSGLRAPDAAGEGGADRLRRGSGRNHRARGAVPHIAAHTERPVTVTSGTAVIVDRKREAILTHARAAMARARNVQELAAAAVGRAHRRTHRTHPGRWKRVAADRRSG